MTLTFETLNGPKHGCLSCVSLQGQVGIDSVWISLFILIEIAYSQPLNVTERAVCIVGMHAEQWVYCSLMTTYQI